MCLTCLEIIACWAYLIKQKRPHPYEYDLYYDLYKQIASRQIDRNEWLITERIVYSFFTWKRPRKKKTLLDILCLSIQGLTKYSSAEWKRSVMKLLWMDIEFQPKIVETLPQNLLIT